MRGRGEGGERKWGLENMFLPPRSLTCVYIAHARITHISTRDGISSPRGHCYVNKATKMAAVAAALTPRDPCDEERADPRIDVRSSSGPSTKARRPRRCLVRFIHKNCASRYAC